MTDFKSLIAEIEQLASARAYTVQRGDAERARAAALAVARGGVMPEDHRATRPEDLARDRALIEYGRKHYADEIKDARASYLSTAKKKAEIFREVNRANGTEFPLPRWIQAEIGVEF